MVGYWIIAALVFGLFVMGVAYMRAGRSNNPMSMLSKVLLVALAPTVLFVAIIELIVVPIWGARTAFSLVPFGFFIWLVSATLLIKRKW